MNLPFYIARRYLFSRKSHNVINLISGISVIGVAFGTMAMIVVLSAFNGIEDLVDDLYSSFDPDIQVRPLKGKTISPDTTSWEGLEQIEGVNAVSRVIEENVILKYQGKHHIATLKGVDPSFLEMSGLDSMMYTGDLALQHNGGEYLVVGLGIKYELDLPVASPSPPAIRISSPIRGRELYKYKQQAFRTEQAMLGGVFSVNADFDKRYALASIDLAREVLGYEQELSGFAISVEPDAKAATVKKRVETHLGAGFDVRTRFEKNKLIYKTNRTEKWITFLILTFILIIATFNIMASLTMLILEKEKDIQILRSMGATSNTIRKIFFNEGMLINIFGGGAGLMTGMILCFLQQQFGLVELQGTIVDHYPVKMEFSDFLSVFLIVLMIGTAASWLPVHYLTRKYFTR